MVYTTTDNNYGTSKLIVGTTGKANYLTIAAALTASVSGDTIFILPGTYTENLTLKAGVNLTSFPSFVDRLATGNVIISGNCTFTDAGSVTISGIQLQTNSAALLTVSGSNASIVNLYDCFINCTNNTGITFSASNTSAFINLYNCIGNLVTTGIAYYTMSSTGYIFLSYCTFNNTGVSTTASSNSAGFVFINYTTASCAFSTSSTGSFLCNQSVLNIGALSNTTVVTTAGSSATNSVILTTVSSGSASAISIGSGTTMQVGNSVIDSTNTNAITGAGTIVYSEIAFQNTSSLINTTTQTRRNIGTGGVSFDGGTNTLSSYTEGTFTPTLVGSTVAGVTTYFSQNGYYRRIGNLVVAQGAIISTASTGTGFIALGALPFTSKNQTNGSAYGSLIFANSATWPAGRTSITLSISPNTAVANIFASGTAVNGDYISIANTIYNIQYTISYEV